MEPADRTVVTIIRLKFKQEGKYVARRSAEWYAAMQRFRKLPNWRYTSAGEGVDDAAEVPVFIGWTDNKPPPAFRTSAALVADMADGTNALSPLLPLLESDPEVLIFCCEGSRITPHAFSTARGFAGPDPLREFMVIRGPRDVLEPVVQSISRALLDFRMIREGARADNSGDKYAFHLHFDGWIEDGYGSEEKDNGTTDGKKQQLRSFVLLPSWSSRQGRAEFQDPSVGEKTLPQHLKSLYGPDFWEKTVALPLRKLEAENGVVVTSWDYHNAGLAEDKKGLMKRRQDDD